MNPLIDMIIDVKIKDKTIQSERHTVRAVILEQEQILLAYSSLYDDYMTPGGGIENESHEAALKRELEEEIGIQVSNIRPIGYIEELRLEKDNKVLYQKSHYYQVDIKSYGKQNLEAYEIRFGLEPKWVNIHEVIKHNEAVLAKRSITGASDIHPFSTLIRENELLKYIVRTYLK